MDKRTVSSAHQRIDELSQRVIKLEVMTEEVLVRMRRLESIMIGSRGDHTPVNSVDVFWMTCA